MGKRGLTLLAAAVATVVGVGVVIAGSNAGVWPAIPWTAYLDLPSDPSSGFGPGVGAEPDPDASYPPAMEVDDLYAAFTTLGSAVSYGEPVNLASASAGSVTLPSGRLVATDAMLPDGDPFEHTALPGEHPVTLLTVDLPDVGDHRVAAAMLRVAAGDPVRWEPATLARDDAGGLGPDEAFGIAVDSGTAAFMGPEAVEALADQAAYEPYSDAVTDGLYPDATTMRDAVVVVVDPGSGADAVAFTTGFGDGWYPVHVGLDADGRPIVFLVDFGLLDAPS